MMSSYILASLLYLLSFATILTNSSVMSLQFVPKLLPSALSKLHLTYTQITGPSTTKQRYQYHGIEKQA
uniref:Secreted protein n=1 Tax=Arundo donax TaxID=35708 RepID=A0A0A9FN32_ARUDO